MEYLLCPNTIENNDFYCYFDLPVQVFLLEKHKLLLFKNEFIREKME